MKKIILIAGLLLVASNGWAEETRPECNARAAKANNTIEEFNKITDECKKITKTRHKVDARSMVERVIDHFKWSHEPIKDWVFKGGVTGRRAMFIESNLVLGVLNKLVKEDIPCVTIYDSFVIPEQFEQRAKELMYAPNNLAWLKKLLAKDQQGQLIQSS